MYQLALPLWSTTGHHKYLSYLEVPETTERRLTVVNWFIKKLKLRKIKEEIFSISRQVKNLLEDYEDKILGMKMQGSTEIKEREAFYDAGVFSLQQLQYQCQKEQQKFVRFSTRAGRYQTETTAYARIDEASIILSLITRTYYKN